MRKILLLLIIIFCAVSNSVKAQENEVVASGTATGIFYAFYFGERDIPRIPVQYEKYSDGSITLKELVDGKDLPLHMGEPDGFNIYNIIIPDVEGLGYNGVYTYEGYENYPFLSYYFDEPATLGPDVMSFIFVDGTSYYDPQQDTVTLDYLSEIDDEEYMFIVDFTLPMEDASGISNIVSSSSDDSLYDLQGRRLNEVPSKGIYIQNGKKFIK